MQQCMRSGTNALHISKTISAETVAHVGTLAWRMFLTLGTKAGKVMSDIIYVIIMVVIVLVGAGIF